MTCRPCLDTYIHTYKQTINQYKQIVLIHKSIETYSYTFTWLQMVRPPQPTHRGGAGTLCVHVVSLCADTKTMTCRPCWDTHILTYQQTDRQTHRHTYINQYKHIVIPIDGCICVTYPPFGGGGGGEPGGPGSYIPLRYHLCWCFGNPFLVKYPALILPWEPHSSSLHARGGTSWILRPILAGPCNSTFKLPKEQPPGMYTVYNLVPPWKLTYPLKNDGWKMYFLLK